MEIVLVLTLIKRSTRSPQSEKYQLWRPYDGDQAPPWNTLMLIAAEDAEWHNFWLRALEFKQPHDKRIEIHLTANWETQPELSNLAPLRAVEILRNANPAWKTYESC